MNKIQVGIDLVTTNVDGKTYSPTDIAALILEKAYSDAQKKYPVATEDVLQAVITIPEHFTFDQLTETAKSGQNAGFEILRVITKPVHDSVSEKEAEIETLQSKIDLLNDENIKLSDNIKILEGEIIDKEERIENLQNKITGSNDEHSKMTDNLKTLGKAVNEKDGKIESLEKQLSGLSDENSRLSENIKTFGKAISDKDRKISELENTIKEKIAAIDKLNAEKTELNKNFEAVRLENEELKKSVEWLRNYSNSTDQKVMDYFAHNKHTLETHNRFLTYERFNNQDYVKYLNIKDADSAAKSENNPQQPPKRKGAIKQIKDFFYTDEEDIDNNNKKSDINKK